MQKESKMPQTRQIKKLQLLEAERMELQQQIQIGTI